MIFWVQFFSPREELSVLAGIGVGAAAVQGLCAQAKPPAYYIVEIDKINNPEGFKAITQNPKAVPPLLRN
jgi:hypothetical protein